MATISNTPRPGYVWDSTDNVWYPIGVGAHQHTNAADTPAVMPYSTYAAAGKNKLINADFAIDQRNNGLLTTSTAMIVDRFSLNYSGGSCSAERKLFSPGAGISNLNVKHYLEYISSGQSGTSDFLRCRGAFEDVYTFAGQTVTFSFYAKAASGTPKIAPAFTQNFGSGGSSSVTTKVGEVTLSTSWARYSVTFTMPSISGKTVGAGNYNTLQLFMSAGSAVDSGTIGIGVQNNTFQFTAFQLEAGSNVTAFETATGNPASELAACQRYYEAIAILAQRNVMAAQSTSSAFGALYYKVTKRGTPTVTLPASGSGTGQIAVLNTGGSYPSTIGTVAADQITVESCTIKVTGATSAYTAGDALVLYTNGAATIAVGAEL